MRATTNSYAGRVVDVELLQSIASPEGTQSVIVSNVAQQPKMVAGIEKLVQRYTNLLLTSLRSVHFDQGVGSEFLPSLLGGFQTLGVMNSEFALASADVLAQMKTEDVNSAYSVTPDDEQIDSATLLDSSVDVTTATAYLRVELISKAGTTYTFVVPATNTRT